MADIGLRVRNQNGYVETSVTTKLTKTIGSYSIPLYDAISSGSGAALRYRAPAAANGGLTIDEFGGGSPFFYFLNNGQKSVWGLLVPQVTIGANTLTWVWNDASVNQKCRAEMFDASTAGRNCVGGVILVYGVYS